MIHECRCTSETMCDYCKRADLATPHVRAAILAARRAGAEAMREACAAVCERAQGYGRPQIAAKIRALPLPGDAKEQP